MKNVMKLFAIGALSFLGFTALEVQAAASKEITAIEGEVSMVAASCWKCDGPRCAGCYEQGQSTSGRQGCSPSGSPFVLCTLVGSACTLTQVCTPGL